MWGCQGYVNRKQQSKWAAVWATVLVIVPRLALAEQQEFGPYHRPGDMQDEWDSEKGSRAHRLATGDYVHDGFYMRFAGGLGGASDKLQGRARDSEGTAGSLDGSAHGFAAATEVAIGFTPARGWVFGVAVDTVTIPSASGKLTPEAGTFEFNTSQSAIYGILIDYYPDPLRGFHVQLNGGLASYVMAQGNADDAAMIAPPHAAAGSGFALGVGNQWWVAPDWTLGILPRLVMGWTSGIDEFGSRFNHRTVGYSLLLTATYH